MDSSLIETVNKIYDAFTTIGVTSPIDLPQIVVVGSQSSGKSSVLENIVGIDFLPRGTGIVTRRPLILQLIHRPGKHGKIGGVAAQQKELVEASQKIRDQERELKRIEKEGSTKNDDTTNLDSADSNSTSTASLVDKTDEFDQWAEFLHIPGKKFHKFSEVRDEIIKDTERKTGRNAGVSPIPINLRIYSPNVVTLTLVDCPGLTKVPVGDQPSDIEHRIREMVTPYIRPANSIILAVTPANTDIANSDGLKLAKEVDPEGARTIGVLTKVDLMDDGTDLVNILAGRVIPLRLGYVPVINRGQKEIESNKSITLALRKERDFFFKHPAYCNKADYCGTSYLARRLNSLLMFHIKNSLPDIKAKIQVSMTRYKNELTQLGYSPIESKNPEPNMVLAIITEFCNSFRSVIDGTSEEISSEELSGGARISYIFHETYSNSVRCMDPFDQIKDTDIRTILYNTSGSSPAVFVGTQAFEVLVKKQISRLLDPSLKCVKLVYDELVKILNRLLIAQTFKRFPGLKNSFQSSTVAFFKSKIAPTDKLVADIVNAQACYINTAHPDFITGQKAMAIVNERSVMSKASLANVSSTNNSSQSSNQQNNVAFNSNATPNNKSSYPRAPPPQPPRPSSPLNNQSLVTSTTAPDSPPPLEQSLVQDDPNANISLKSVNQDNFFGSFFAKKRKPGTMESPPAILKPSSNVSERERTETDIIKLLILSYYNIVKRSVADLIPKIIMLNLVSQVKTELQPYLLYEIYKKGNMNELLKECDSVIARRHECLRMIEALQKADEILSAL